MQFNIKKLSSSLGLVAASMLMLSFNPVYADAAKKTSLNKVETKTAYTEDQFLDAFSGKMKAQVIAKLGEPARKEASVKPAGAGAFIEKAGADEKNSKRVNVEMWYYKDLVHYDPKHKYKETEMTLVNDRVMNIAFFNNK
ncbi:MAG: hypothetical protein WBP13_01345 [Methylophilaceae bacterium]